jgi:hypothetical protein
MQKYKQSGNEAAFHVSCIIEVINRLTQENIKISGIDGRRITEDYSFFDPEVILNMSDFYMENPSSQEINQAAINFVKNFLKEKDLYMIVTTSVGIPLHIIEYIKSMDS